MNEQKFFAAFIMTYERPEVLLDTIEKILRQTFPPEKILVVDNSASEETKDIIERKKNDKVLYYRVGYNAGPAGAAYYGLQFLCNQGYKWVYWADDDDPPQEPDVFERLLGFSNNLQDIGALGSVGGKFDNHKVRTSSLKNNQIQGLTEVDYIPGGYNFIINCEVVRKNILPTKELFFGFEELDFCLKIKKAGYNIYIDGEGLINKRNSLGKTDPNYKWQGKGFGKDKDLWRQYYSSRNMLKILVRNGYWIGVIYFLIKLIAKSAAGFRYGLKFGVRNFKIQWLAIFHFLCGRFGKVDFIKSI